jgi:aubergine
MNSRATTYWSAVKVQEEGAEVANQLQECFADALNEFKKKNGAFPKRVVIYRDGVGTGQMGAVSTIEVPQLKAAISEVTDGQEDEIKLMVVLVNKRISQRFFNGTRGRLQNPEPGTVVSSAVVE